MSGGSSLGQTIALVRELLDDGDTSAEHPVPGVQPTVQAGVFERLQAADIAVPTIDMVPVAPLANLRSIARESGRKLAAKLSGGLIRDTAVLGRDEDFRRFIGMRIRIKEAAQMASNAAVVSERLHSCACELVACMVAFAAELVGTPPPSDPMLLSLLGLKGEKAANWTKPLHGTTIAAAFASAFGVGMGSSRGARLLSTSATVSARILREFQRATTLILRAWDALSGNTPTFVLYRGEAVRIRKPSPELLESALSLLDVTMRSAALRLSSAGLNLNELEAVFRRLQGITPLASAAVDGEGEGLVQATYSTHAFPTFYRDHPKDIKSHSVHNAMNLVVKQCEEAARAVGAIVAATKGDVVAASALPATRTEPPATPSQAPQVTLPTPRSARSIALGQTPSGKGFSLSAAALGGMSGDDGDAGNNSSSGSFLASLLASATKAAAKPPASARAKSPSASASSSRVDFSPAPVAPLPFSGFSSPPPAPRSSTDATDAVAAATATAMSGKKGSLLRAALLYLEETEGKGSKSKKKAKKSPRKELGTPSAPIAADAAPAAPSTSVPGEAIMSRLESTITALFSAEPERTPSTSSTSDEPMSALASSLSSLAQSFLQQPDAGAAAAQDALRAALSARASEEPKAEPSGTPQPPVLQEVQDAPSADEAEDAGEEAISPPRASSSPLWRSLFGSSTKASGSAGGATASSPVESNGTAPYQSYHFSSGRSTAAASPEAVATVAAVATDLHRSVDTTVPGGDAEDDNDNDENRDTLAPLPNDVPAVQTQTEQAAPTPEQGDQEATPAFGSGSVGTHSSMTPKGALSSHSGMRVRWSDSPESTAQPDEATRPPYSDDQVALAVAAAEALLARLDAAPQQAVEEVASGPSSRLPSPAGQTSAVSVSHSLSSSFGGGLRGALTAEAVAAATSPTPPSALGARIGARVDVPTDKVGLAMAMATNASALEAADGPSWVTDLAFRRSYQQLSSSPPSSANPGTGSAGRSASKQQRHSIGGPAFSLSVKSPRINSALLETANSASSHRSSASSVGGGSASSSSSSGWLAAVVARAPSTGGIVTPSSSQLPKLSLLVASAKIGGPATTVGGPVSPLPTSSPSNGQPRSILKSSSRSSVGGSPRRATFALDLTNSGKPPLTAFLASCDVSVDGSQEEDSLAATIAARSPVAPPSVGTNSFSQLPPLSFGELTATGAASAKDIGPRSSSPLRNNSVGLTAVEWKRSPVPVPAPAADRRSGITPRSALGARASQYDSIRSAAPGPAIVSSGSGNDQTLLAGKGQGLQSLLHSTPATSELAPEDGVVDEIPGQEREGEDRFAEEQHFVAEETSSSEMPSDNRVPASEQAIAANEPPADAAPSDEVGESEDRAREEAFVRTMLLELQLLAAGDQESTDSDDQRPAEADAAAAEGSSPEKEADVDEADEADEERIRAQRRALLLGLLGAEQPRVEQEPPVSDVADSAAELAGFEPAVISAASPEAAPSVAAYRELIMALEAGNEQDKASNEEQDAKPADNEEGMEMEKTEELAEAATAAAFSAATASFELSELAALAREVTAMTTATAPLSDPQKLQERTARAVQKAWEQLERQAAEASNKKSPISSAEKAHLPSTGGSDEGSSSATAGANDDSGLLLFSAADFSVDTTAVLEEHASLLEQLGEMGASSNDVGQNTSAPDSIHWLDNAGPVIATPGAPHRHGSTSADQPVIVSRELLGKAGLGSSQDKDTGRTPLVVIPASMLAEPANSTQEKEQQQTMQSPVFVASEVARGILLHSLPQPVEGLAPPATTASQYTFSSAVDIAAFADIYDVAVAEDQVAASTNEQPAKAAESRSRSRSPSPTRAQASKSSSARPSLGAVAAGGLGGNRTLPTFSSLPTSNNRSGATSVSVSPRSTSPRFDGSATSGNTSPRSSIFIARAGSPQAGYAATATPHPSRAAPPPPAIPLPPPAAVGGPSSGNSSRQTSHHNPRRSLSPSLVVHVPKELLTLHADRALAEAKALEAAREAAAAAALAGNGEEEDSVAADKATKTEKAPAAQQGRSRSSSPARRGRSRTPTASSAARAKSPAGGKATLPRPASPEAPAAPSISPVEPAVVATEASQPAQGAESTTAVAEQPAPPVPAPDAAEPSPSPTRAPRQSRATSSAAFLQELLQKAKAEETDQEEQQTRMEAAAATARLAVARPPPPPSASAASPVAKVAGGRRSISAPAIEVQPASLPAAAALTEGGPSPSASPSPSSLPSTTPADSAVTPKPMSMPVPPSRPAPTPPKSNKGSTASSPSAAAALQHVTANGEVKVSTFRTSSKEQALDGSASSAAVHQPPSPVTAALEKAVEALAAGLAAESAAAESVPVPTGAGPEPALSTASAPPPVAPPSQSASAPAVAAEEEEADWGIETAEDDHAEEAKQPAEPPTEQPPAQAAFVEKNSAPPAAVAPAAAATEPVDSSAPASAKPEDAAPAPLPHDGRGAVALQETPAEQAPSSVTSVDDIDADAEWGLASAPAQPGVDDAAIAPSSTFESEPSAPSAAESSSQAAPLPSSSTSPSSTASPPSSSASPPQSSSPISSARAASPGKANSPSRCGNKTRSSMKSKLGPSSGGSSNTASSAGKSASLWQLAFDEDEDGSSKNAAAAAAAAFAAASRAANPVLRPTDAPQAASYHYTASTGASAVVHRIDLSHEGSNFNDDDGDDDDDDKKGRKRGVRFAEPSPGQDSPFYGASGDTASASNLFIASALLPSAKSSGAEVDAGGAVFAGYTSASSAGRPRLLLEQNLSLGFGGIGEFLGSAATQGSGATTAGNPDEKRTRTPSPTSVTAPTATSVTTSSGRPSRSGSSPVSSPSVRASSPAFQSSSTSTSSSSAPALTSTTASGPSAAVMAAMAAASAAVAPTAPSSSPSSAAAASAVKGVPSLPSDASAGESPAPSKAPPPPAVSLVAALSPLEQALAANKSKNKGKEWSSLRMSAPAPATTVPALQASASSAPASAAQTNHTVISGLPPAVPTLLPPPHPNTAVASNHAAVASSSSSQTPTSGMPSGAPSATASRRSSIGSTGQAIGLGKSPHSAASSTTGGGSGKASSPFVRANAHAQPTPAHADAVASKQEKRSYNIDRDALMRAQKEAEAAMERAMSQARSVALGLPAVEEEPSAPQSAEANAVPGAESEKSEPVASQSLQEEAAEHTWSEADAALLITTSAETLTQQLKTVASSMGPSASSAAASAAVLAEPPDSDNSPAASAGSALVETDRFGASAGFSSDGLHEADQSDGEDEDEGSGAGLSAAVEVQPDGEQPASIAASTPDSPVATQDAGSANAESAEPLHPPSSSSSASRRALLASLSLAIEQALEAGDQQAAASGLAAFEQLGAQILMEEQQAQAQRAGEEEDQRQQPTLESLPIPVPASRRLSQRRSIMEAAGLVALKEEDQGDAEGDDDAAATTNTPSSVPEQQPTAPSNHSTVGGQALVAIAPAVDAITSAAIAKRNSVSSAERAPIAVPETGNSSAIPSDAATRGGAGSGLVSEEELTRSFGRAPRGTLASTAVARPSIVGSIASSRAGSLRKVRSIRFIDDDAQQQTASTIAPADVSSSAAEGSSLVVVGPVVDHQESSNTAAAVASETSLPAANTGGDAAARLSRTRATRPSFARTATVASTSRVSAGSGGTTRGSNVDALARGASNALLQLDELSEGEGDEDGDDNKEEEKGEVEGHNEQTVVASSVPAPPRATLTAPAPLPLPTPPPAPSSSAAPSLPLAAPSGTSNLPLLIGQRPASTRNLLGSAGAGSGPPVSNRNLLGSSSSGPPAASNRNLLGGAAPPPPPPPPHGGPSGSPREAPPPPPPPAKGTPQKTEPVKDPEEWGTKRSSKGGLLSWARKSSTGKK